MRQHSSWSLGLVLVITMGVSACRGGGQAPAGEPEGTVPATLGETSEAGPAAAPESKVPADTLVQVGIGEPQSLDPPWTYETAGSGLQANIYEGLLYFDREKPDAYVPALATDWQVSDDGLTYTFTIRDGVTFHEGGTLEPHDIAYSLQRGLLQSRSEGPMWLFLEPLLGTSSIEDLAVETAGLSAAEGQPKPTLEQVPDAAKAQVCEAVKAAVGSDDQAKSVTLRLTSPAPWFPQLLSQPWASVLDQEWMAEQGDWNGDCGNWAEYFDPEAQESVLFDRANGTGPYTLGSWKKGQEITLEANGDYWRTEPIWEGGPSGPPALQHVVLQFVEEWGTRFAKLQAGEADVVAVPRAQIDQLEPLIHTEYLGADEQAESKVINENGSLKLFRGYPSVSAEAAIMNFNVNTEGGKEFIGSGALDGEGVPADFFSDEHVRRAFNYCFDWETYLQDAMRGEGVQTRGPIIAGLQGYSEDSTIYSFDPDQCKSELEQAWGGQVAANGFKLVAAYNQGNEARQTAAEILADNLAQVDPRYVVEPQGLEWPTFLDATNSHKVPLFFLGWLEDYHDAGNWVHPFMHSAGAYSAGQGFPAEMQAQFDGLIEQALVETDSAKRSQTYAELQRLAIEEAIDIFMAQATGRFYINRAVSGWFNNPLTPGLWYYALSKPSP
jgi:peptide/nickel transport system substrate-binding protein